MLLIMTLFSPSRAAVGNHVSYCACWCGSLAVRSLHAQPHLGRGRWAAPPGSAGHQCEFWGGSVCSQLATIVTGWGLGPVHK